MDMSVKIIILAGHDLDDLDWTRSQIGIDDLIICADSGLRHAIALGVIPEYVIGDFDSVDPAHLDWAKAQQGVAVHHDADQNATDLQKALRLSQEHSKDAQIIVFGALGGRLDHQFGNILSLEQFDGHSRIALRDKTTHLRLLSQPFSFEGQIGDYVGVIPLRETKNLRYEGLEYAAEDLGPPYNLGWLGTSNVMSADEGRVDFDSGIVLFIHTSVPD